MEEEKKIKYSSYTEAQKKATQKYRENNKEKVNEQRKKYYQNRKIKDPNFLEYKRLKAKEYYQKKKLNATKKDKIIEDFVDNIIDVEQIDGLMKLIIEDENKKKNEIIEITIADHPILDESVIEKKVRKYIKKVKK